MTTLKKLKVEVWIFCRLPDTGTTQFLLLRTRPDRGGFWQPVTGSVEPGETLEAAALREAQEESGLTFSTPVRPLDRSFEYESRGQTFHEHGFYIEASLKDGHLPAIKLDPHEHVEGKWISAPEVFPLLKFSANAEMLRTVQVQTALTRTSCARGSLRSGA